MTADDQAFDREDGNPNEPLAADKNVHAKRKTKRLLLPLIIFGIMFVVGGSILVRASQQAREAAHRTSCKCHIKQLTLALYNYLDTYGSFPPPYTTDAEGNPLHSWRTLLLPFLDRKDLYEQIDLTKPFDHPANQKVFDSAPSVYTCPSSVNDAKLTCYQVILSNDSFFSLDKSITVKDIKDGTSNTIMFVEAPVEQAVMWMSPLDLSVDGFLSINLKTKFNHDGGFHAAMGDGSARFISSKISQASLRSLMTRDGEDRICDDF